MQTHLEREMGQLKLELKRLTDLVLKTVELSTYSFREMDTKGAQEVIANDKEIDQLEIKVEEDSSKSL